jgi:hypothetical protein
VSNAIILFAASLAVVFQTGCSEPSQGLEYRDGRYAGKPDTPNWQGDAFDGKRNWEKEIKRRTKLQSEYTRPGGA